MLSFEKTHENFWNQNKQLKKKENSIGIPVRYWSLCDSFMGTLSSGAVVYAWIKRFMESGKKKKKKKKKLQDDLREGRFSTLKINILQDFTKKEFSSGVTSRSF